MSIAVLTLLGTMALESTIYKCDVNGQMVYSQKPCAEDAEEIETDDLVQDSGLRADESIGESADENRAERALNRREDIMRRQSARVIADYETEIRVCEQRASRALNNLAGATYDQTQRQCIANFQRLISEERQSLEDRVLQMRQSARSE